MNILQKINIRLNPAFEKHRRYMLYGLGGFVFVFLLFVLYVFYDMPSLKQLENPDSNERATEIISADGITLGTFYRDQNRIWVRNHEIPPHLKDALIQTEDKRFYQHSGIDFLGVLNMFKSMLTYVFTRDMRGGSTITMQLARNLYDEEVGVQRNALRKFKEMLVSIYLENKFTKHEILEQYLNTVPFGGNYYGVQSASLHYFEKKCKELTVDEGAILVGMLKGPSYYNPRRFPERCKERRNIVLQLMYEGGKLNKKQYETFVKMPIKVVNTKRLSHNDGPAPYFREYLRRWLQEWCATTSAKIVVDGKKKRPSIHDGLRVYTTIDARLQKHAEAAMAEHLSKHQTVFDEHIRGSEPWKYDTTILVRACRQSERYRLLKEAKLTEPEIFRNFKKTKLPMRVFKWHNGQPSYTDTTLTPWDSLKYYAKFLECGIVSIDQANGQIKAWVGGLDHEYFKYDHVMQGKRQVGSTFKPIAYTAAFDNNYSPCYMMEESKVEIIVDEGRPTEKRWVPKNWDDTYGTGEMMSLKTALTQSSNIITAKLTQLITPQTVVKYARDMGITSHLEAVPAVSLGTFDLSVTEIAKAYLTMANEHGRLYEPYFVTRIEDKDGNELERFSPPSKEALSEETAYLMKETLRGVVLNGSAGTFIHGTYQVPINIQVAGKSGTTNDFSDGWYAGFTPEFTTVVWVGCSDRSVHFRYGLNGQGSFMALPIWAKYIKRAYEDKTLNLDMYKTFVPKRVKVETDCYRYNQNNRVVPERNRDADAYFNPDDLD